MEWKTLPYHVLKTSKNSSSDDAQEQADDVENGGRPEQVVEVDDVLATVDIDVFIVPTSDFHPAGQRESYFSQSQGTSWPLGHWLTHRYHTHDCTWGARHYNKSKCDGCL